MRKKKIINKKVDNWLRNDTSTLYYLQYMNS